MAMSASASAAFSDRSEICVLPLVADMCDLEKLIWRDTILDDCIICVVLAIREREAPFVEASPSLAGTGFCVSKSARKRVDICS